MDKKLFDIASNIRKFANEIEKANQKAKNVNISLLIDSNVSQSDENGYLDFFTNKNLRLVFGELYNKIKSMNQSEINEILLFISLCAYNQDWDYVFDTIKDYRGKTFYEWHNEKQEKINPFNVKSWGRVYQNYDTNFLNQIRNGLAHSKFQYNPNTKNITISMNNGEFVVDVNLEFLIYLPNMAWEISEKSTSNEARQSTIFLENGAYNNIVMFVIKNEKPEEKNWNKRLKSLGLNSDEIKAIDRVSSIVKENGNGLTLVDKMNWCQKSIDLILEKINSNQKALDIIKIIYEKFGLTIESDVKFNFYDVCEKDSFEETFFANMFFDKNISESDRNLNFTRALKIKKDEQSQNFLANNAVISLFMNAKSSDSFGKFRTMLKNSYIPLSLNEFSFFLDKAYLNMVFNYFAEKSKESGEIENFIKPFKETSATEYFDSNEYTENLSLDQTFYYIRNCVVHPRFMKRDGDNYILSDYNKKGELVFNAIIARDKFIELANNVATLLQEEKNKEEDEEECNE